MASSFISCACVWKPFCRNLRGALKGLAGSCLSHRDERLMGSLGFCCPVASASAERERDSSLEGKSQSCLTPDLVGGEGQAALKRFGFFTRKTKWKIFLMLDILFWAVGVDSVFLFYLLFSFFCTIFKDSSEQYPWTVSCSEKHPVWLCRNGVCQSRSQQWCCPLGSVVMASFLACLCSSPFICIMQTVIFLDVALINWDHSCQTLRIVSAI